MQGRKTARIVRMDEETREKLLSWLRATKTPQGLAERLLTFVSQWNEHAHPFNWSTKSAAKVMAKCQLSQAA